MSKALYMPFLTSTDFLFQIQRIYSADDDCIVERSLAELVSCYEMCDHDISLTTPPVTTARSSRYTSQ